MADLETEEQLIASYENRAPRWPKDLIKEENDRVESERSDLKLEIKTDQERLDQIWPEELRIKAREDYKAATESAIKVIASSGNADEA